MNPYYRYSSSYADILDSSIPPELIAVWIGLFAVVAIFAIATYILSSLSLFTLGKRRGVRAYGLAWVPVVCYWVLGSLADHFDAQRSGDHKWRVILVVAGSLTVVFAIIYAVFLQEYIDTLVYLTSYFPGALVGLIAS